MNGYGYGKITTTTVSFGFYPQKPDYTDLDEYVRGESKKQKSKKNLDYSKKDYTNQTNYYSGNPNKTKKNSEYYPNTHQNNVSKQNTVPSTKFNMAKNSSQNNILGRRLGRSIHVKQSSRRYTKLDGTRVEEEESEYSIPC
jgi:hypothetical protein